MMIANIAHYAGVKARTFDGWCLRIVCHQVANPWTCRPVVGRITFILSLERQLLALSTTTTSLFSSFRAALIAAMMDLRASLLPLLAACRSGG